MRYLPSFVIFIVLAAALIFADRVHIKVLEKDKREAADATLRNVQTQLDRFVSRTVRGSRRLAAKIDPSVEIDQQTFDDIVSNTDTGPAQLSRAEYAPGFITRLVYPLQGNETYIGKSPLRPPSDGQSPLQSDVARGFPTLASVDVLQSGLAELHVRTELREVADSTVISTGLVHLVKQFELSIVDPTGRFTPGEVDFLYQVRPAGGQAPDLPESWRVNGSMEPINYTMSYPPGDFMLYARPINGWDIAASESAGHRLQFGIMGLLLLLPVVLANWFAVARGATRGRLSRAQKQMSGLLQNLPGAAFTYTIAAGNNGPGPDDRISFLNPESCMEIWGVEGKMIEQDPSLIWDRLAGEDVVVQLETALVSSMHSMTPMNEIYPINTLQGEHKWLHTKAIPARNSDGSMYWSALVIDNTEAIEREAELEKQQELAFRAQKSEIVGQLTGGVAHDFNNLLAVILGNLELLQTNPDHPEREDLMEDSINSTLRGADLTKNMLAFARRSRLKPEVLQLNDLLNEVRRWIERTLPATITVQMNLADDLWSVSADRSSTESALLNLILNARDAMDERGNLIIETVNKTIDESDNQEIPTNPKAGKYVVLSVTDNGSGIEDEHLQNIYEPFFSTKETGKGSGLGLSMVMGFIQQSGGAVKAATERGLGTVFKLYFPAVSQMKVVNTVLDKAVFGSSSGGRVLLAEDDPDVGEMLTRTLEQEGYEVVLARSGDEALSLFNNDQAFDVLLTDMIMPGQLQGRDIASALRAKQPDLAVVYISGYIRGALLLDAESEADSVTLNKPVQRTELIAAINRALSTSAKRIAAGSENTFSVS